MSIKLNQIAVDHAKYLINSGEIEREKKWDWQEHKATMGETVRFINTHYIKGEYGQWFLGIDTEIDADNKDRYLFPIGDFRIIHREGIAAALENAKGSGYNDIADAAQRLLNYIDRQIN